ncbi:uncharacterized protein LOC101858991 [Aplysia californica]|uniref:Uncharacterized protein LOC101858991 n=1 Tax=Aplysia californica TaxID=6500 RepID=A0ABM1AFM7_APLCA|nr:uncharacterized protein LOC101858991 [Aplysia californica]
MEIHTSLYGVGLLFFFSLEFYHAVAHTMIMGGFRTLPRKDLVRIRMYFLVDALSVFVSSFLLTGSYKWLAVIQIIQHMFYFITWDKSYMAKKIIDWSCLDWFKSEKKKDIQLDSTLGTLFDIVVHVVMMYAIGQQLSGLQIFIAMLIAQAALYAVIFNPKFAWSSPSSMPAWVQRRLGKLALED